MPELAQKRSHQSAGAGLREKLELIDLARCVLIHGSPSLALEDSRLRFRRQYVALPQSPDLEGARQHFAWHHPVERLEVAPDHRAEAFVLEVEDLLLAHCQISFAVLHDALTCVDSRSYWPSTQQCSIVTFWPST